MQLTSLNIPAEERIGLNVRNLSVTAGAHRILNDVSFDLPECSLLAIMGGSGSGKTTLLNTLSQRTNITDKKLKFEGRITYSNTVNHAYLLQTDCFLAGLSVLETLQTQADLRMPEDVSSADKAALVELLLEILELNHLRSTRILEFLSTTSTLSGGEQRRVSLAIQLLCRPLLLFLDEPTTGLDTSSSLKLVESLKTLCLFGMTIVLSIHQPRPEIIETFDKVCLLTRGGRLVYYGGLSDVGGYFENVPVFERMSTEKLTIDSAANSEKTDQIEKSSQLPSLSSYGVLEQIIHMSVKDTSSKELEFHTNAQIDLLVDNWKNHSAHPQENLSQEESSTLFNANLALFKRNKISLFREVVITTKRTFKLTYRDISSIIAFNGACTVLALAVGLIFYKPTPDLAGIRSITSVLYVMLEVIGFCPMLFELERLWLNDGVYFQREYQENIVLVPGFILSRRLGKFFLEDMLVPILFAIITYFMWGLRMHDPDGNLDALYFAVYLGLTILTYLAGVGTAIFIFAISPDFTISSLLLNAAYQLQNSACGYFVNAATMPVYVRWTKYIAYFWYAFGALNANQFTDWMGDCPDSDKTSPVCVEYSGNSQLKVLGFPQGWIAAPTCILLAWFIGFHLIAAVALRLKSSNMTMTKQKKNRIGGEDEADKSESLEETLNKESPRMILELPINISISDTNVSVKSGLFGKTKIQLLHDINADFLANKVNVIMGPSGSGKTTLLNYLSNRSKVHFTGSIDLNSCQEILRRDLSKISGYVTQQDNSLIAKLTVRETLFYQAHLRLPVEQHPEIPRIVAAMIRSTGLTDCAETLIGDEYAKGISGGEKRRVSIAIQLLSKPKVLFLDEPTSGLDSTTACTILALLADLAVTNCTTVVMTIHQPHQEMFYSFGLVLLLARGGHVVYNGATTNIADYLTSVGYPVTKEMNIADYMMDLLSVLDGQTEQYEQRVSALIDFWTERSITERQYIKPTENSSIDLSMYFFRKLPFGITFPTIARRQFLNIMRLKDVVFSRAGQTIFLTIIHTLYFAPLRNNSAGINNRLGLIQEALNLYYVGIINNITIYPIERDLFYQEYKDGIYGVLEFSCSYLVNELPTEIIPSFFFAALIVFVCGLPRTAGMFFAMFFTLFASINIGESLGIFVNSIIDHSGAATNVLTNSVILAIFMGGTMSLHMPKFFRGLNWINPMKFAVGLCARLGLEGQEFDCGLEVCALSSGDEVLKYYGFDQLTAAEFAVGLIVCLFVYRLIAVGAVYLKVNRR